MELLKRWWNAFLRILTNATPPASRTVQPTTDADDVPDCEGVELVMETLLINAVDTQTVDDIIDASNDVDLYDLTQIKGIGPKIAEKLNSAGVITLSQIAEWEQTDIDRIDAHLSFRGRIVRDNWIEKAKVLIAV